MHNVSQHTVLDRFVDLPQDNRVTEQERQTQTHVMADAAEQLFQALRARPLVLGTLKQRGRHDATSPPVVSAALRALARTGITRPGEASLSEIGAQAMWRYCSWTSAWCESLLAFLSLAFSSSVSLQEHYGRPCFTSCTSLRRTCAKMAFLSRNLLSSIWCLL